MDSAGDVVGFRNAEFNPAFAREMTKVDPPRRTFRELFQEVESSWIECYAEVLRTGISIRFQERIPTLDRWLDVFVSRVGGPGAKRVALLFADTSESKRLENQLRTNEEKLRLIVENAREHAIFSTDLERRITSWNSGAQQLLGYTAEEITGEFCDIIFTPEDRAAGAPLKETSQALIGGRAADVRWHVRKDGSRFWCSGSLLSMRAVPEGEAVGFVKILRDETPARKAQLALEQSYEELSVALAETEKARSEAEAASQAKDHLLAVLSHELRAPLTPVAMGIHMLAREKDLSPGAKEILEMIDRNVKLEVSLIDELLDVTRIARGKLELARVPLDLHDVLRRAIEVAMPDFSAKKQRFDQGLEAAAHAISGDAARLQQAFWNLLKNASKFSSAGGIIRVQSRNEFDPRSTQERIVVEVSDNGIGFEPEAAGRIFTPFSQASEAITREFGGLGLGLAIAKATIEGHNGTLRAFSTGSGQGATFVVELSLLSDSSSAK